MITSATDPFIIMLVVAGVVEIAFIAIVVVTVGLNLWWGWHG
jgi:hypothetical protein